jgi:hypothetical protein
VAGGWSDEVWRLPGGREVRLWRHDLGEANLYRAVGVEGGCRLAKPRVLPLFSGGIGKGRAKSETHGEDAVAVVRRAT